MGRRRRNANARSPEDVKAIATYQKGIILCILAQFASGITFAGLREARVVPDEVLVIGVLAVYVVVAVTALVCIFQLASRTYGSVAAGLLGLVVLVPCLGLLALLIINGQATSILQAN